MGPPAGTEDLSDTSSASPARAGPFRRHSRGPRPPSAPPPRVGTLEVLLRLGGFALLFVVVLIALGLAVVLAAGETDSLLVHGGAMCLAALAATFACLRLDRRSTLARSGLHRRGASGQLARGFAFGVAVVVPVVALAVAGGLRYGPDGGTVVEYLGTGAWTAFVLLPAAAGEEILCRGYALQLLADRWGSAVAVALTTLIFAVLHGANPNVTGLALLNIALAGLLLGVVRVVTGSLWAATGVHLGWNFATGFLADLPVSGLSLVDAPLLEVVEPGADWIAGGAFGVEAGLASTAGLALAIGFVALGARRRRAGSP